MASTVGELERVTTKQVERTDRKAKIDRTPFKVDGQEEDDGAGRIAEKIRESGAGALISEKIALRRGQGPSVQKDARSGGREARGPRDSVQREPLEMTVGGGETGISALRS